TTAATEAMYLMMKWAFEAGYRRYEWKCNALNHPSRCAAQRLGFSFEGVFRQALLVKGRNRDTAWFAMIDKDWPALKEAFEAWLSQKNFTQDGEQKERLGDLTALVRVSSDPTL
ncbi:MAG: GNAT family N-acetyltransferase, partial [Marinovum sp.]|nr:GNAT family N-acetyltransferase [Marinovum sp.]